MKCQVGRPRVRETIVILLLLSSSSLCFRPLLVQLDYTVTKETYTIHYSTVKGGGPGGGSFFSSKRPLKLD